MKRMLPLMKRVLPVISLTLALLYVCGASARAQASGASGVEVKPLAARLGYTADAKLLIVHADDIGVAHSVNAATFKAFESGLVTSGSIMIPCAWLPEVAAYARSHTDADLGLHLTLTSEWATYRWGGVLSRERAPSLYAADGYLYPSESEASSHADVREAEAEVRAQIARARAFGISPTHLDSHMRTLYETRPLFEMLLRVAREEGLPVMVSREWFTDAPFLPAALGPEGVALDRIETITPAVKPEGWAQFYRDFVKGLRPGVTELIIHLAYNDEEMRAVTREHPDWGSAWRQRDFDYTTGEEFRRLLKENNVKLITWREVGKLVAKPRS
jgi:predicted glycoside hydrolase/deacetylase ChbG (UPF0249 family)